MIVSIIQIYFKLLAIVSFSVAAEECVIIGLDKRSDNDGGEKGVRGKNKDNEIKSKLNHANADYMSSAINFGRVKEPHQLGDEANYGCPCRNM